VGKIVQAKRGAEAAAEAFVIDPATGKILGGALGLAAQAGKKIYQVGDKYFIADATAALEEWASNTTLGKAAFKIGGITISKSISPHCPTNRGLSATHAKI
jgi:hypothetical protein